MLLDKNKPFYSVVQVAEILGISPDRLRTYDEEKLITPTRQKNSRKRLYSELDIEWLELLRKIISKNKMNIYSLKLMLKVLRVLPQKEFQKLLEEDKSDEIWQLFKALKENPNF